MEIVEKSKTGCRLFLEIDGKVREFFIMSENKQYASFSSSLIDAGDCIRYLAKLAEIIEERYDRSGLNIYYSPEKYEYFKGYAGLNYVVDFRELTSHQK